MADPAVAVASAAADILVATAQPEMPAPHTSDEDVRLDTPLPALRAPQATEDTMVVDDNDFDVPMVPLRNESTQQEYLVFARSPSPTLTEPYEEDPDDLEYIPGSGQPDRDRVESTAAGPANDAEAFPLPPSTSSHSMRNQSIRSFEARTRKGVTASKSTPTVKAPGVRKTASSSTAITRSLTSLSPTEPALSGAELSLAAGYIPHYNADRAPEFRKKIVANQEQIIGAVVGVEKKVAQVNDEHTQLLKDLLQRIADTHMNTGSASSPLIQNTCAVVDRLRKSVGESRDQISKLTDARFVQFLRALLQPTPPVSPHRHPSPQTLLLPPTVPPLVAGTLSPSPLWVQREQSASFHPAANRRQNIPNPRTTSFWCTCGRSSWIRARQSSGLRRR
ncbi:hypothetical protein C8R43DRAFT_17658 [Mycena crocata]|nr:hypothetical protein C8R43DRAFT_17658 [Mycena crocata]